MEKFNTHSGIVIPLDRANVDTDAIIPKQFLKSIKKTGFGKNLFDEWRYLDHGEPDQDISSRKINPEFVLNKKEYQGGSVLLAKENFGCGSSREHAPWAIIDYGIKVIIAPSFADIFYGNCFKNGILPITLDSKIVDALFQRANQGNGFRLNIDLENQKIFDENNAYAFEVDTFKKYCLLEGLDDIGLTLRHENKIKQFESDYRKNFPWLGK